MSANLYLFVAMVAWACWQLAAKVALRFLSPIEAQTVFTLSGVLFLPFYLYGRSAFQRMPFSWTGVGFAALASLLGTVAMLAYSSALTTKDIGASVFAITAYPALAMLLAVPILGEHLTWTRVIGMMLVITGVVIAR